MHEYTGGTNPRPELIDGRQCPQRATLQLNGPHGLTRIVKKLDIPVSDGSEGQITDKEKWVSKQKWPESDPSSAEEYNSPPPAHDDDEEEDDEDDEEYVE